MHDGGKRETGNGKRETGNGKRETGNGKRETGNGKRETKDGHRPGIGLEAKSGGGRGKMLRQGTEHREGT
ncbi:hypothetical protein C5B76_13435 [Aeromonas salmonicida]|nr:hypothetical protein C5B76_13435 [Aeromonas salmonicida]